MMSSLAKTLSILGAIKTARRVRGSMVSTSTLTSSHLSSGSLTSGRDSEKPIVDVYLEDVGSNLVESEQRPEQGRKYLVMKR